MEGLTSPLVFLSVIWNRIAFDRADTFLSRDEKSVYIHSLLTELPSKFTDQPKFHLSSHFRLLSRYLLHHAYTRKNWKRGLHRSKCCTPRNDRRLKWNYRIQNLCCSEIEKKKKKTLIASTVPEAMWYHNHLIKDIWVQDGNKAWNEWLINCCPIQCSSVKVSSEAPLFVTFVSAFLDIVL